MLQEIRTDGVAIYGNSSGLLVGTNLGTTYCGLLSRSPTAFIKADNFFLAAALIAGRDLALLRADFSFHLPQRCLIASEIRLRAAALM